MSLEATPRVEPPYYSAITGRWTGEKPPRRGPDNPRCPRCQGESKIQMHRHFDSDGRFHEAVYRCLECHLTFGPNVLRRTRLE